MIQDINPKHFYNQFQKEDINSGDYIISFHDNLIFAKEAGNDLDFIRYEDFLEWKEKVHGEKESGKEPKENFTLHIYLPSTGRNISC